MTRCAALLLPAALIAVVFALQTSGLDVWLQAHWYDAAAGQWWWDRREPVSKFLFYDGIKHLLIGFAVLLALALSIGRRWRLVRRNRRGMLTVLLSLILVPAVVGGLKAVTNVPCPRQIAQFGGAAAHATVFDWRPAMLSLPVRHQCFPAGHASGGFALISLYYLFRTRRARRLGLLAGMSCGWSMGAYKMLIGDHFLSHTLVSLLLAWLIAAGLATLTGARADCPDRTAA